MSEFIQKSIEETEKLAVDSKNPKNTTNWCDIPMEMRAECIKRMDFKTRTRLGATSHTEKSLVESKKYKFDLVELEHMYGFYASAENTEDGDVIEQVQADSDDFDEKMMSCLVKILKTCEIDTFMLSHLDDTIKIDEFWPEIKKCAPFRFRNVTWRDSKETAFRILENCEEVENVKLTAGDPDDVKLTDLMGIRAVRCAKTIRITSGMKDMDGFDEYVKTWIDNKDKIGKTFRVDGRAPDVIQSMGTAFGSRVIYQKMNEVRIRTDDESKHILIRHRDTTVSVPRAARKHATPPPCAFSCAIIPSDLLESEYEKM